MRDPHLLPPRGYFCRTCSKLERSALVPSGWYSLGRHTGRLDERERLGLYCSLACLRDAVARLRDGLNRHGVLPESHTLA